jgi:hypothetical protein
MVKEYIDLLKKALGQIEPGYFRLVTTYNPRGIVRERIFCYELYHQIRLSMEPRHTLSFHGEIDKSGHLDFNRQDRANPDFVFHIPGTHLANTLVIEIKGSVNKRKGILKDFDTILTFISKYRYSAGIFILYNHSFDELMDRVRQEILELRSNPNAVSVYILTIKQPRSECEENILNRI